MQRMVSELPAAVRDVIEERIRQMTKEGFTSLHDSQYKNSELAQAAACYALNTIPSPRNGTMSLYDKIVVQFGRLWPWDWSWWKPKNRRRDLVRAAALLLAEIELGDNQHGGKHW